MFARARSEWKGRLDLAIDATAIKKKPSGWLRKMMLVGAYQLIVQERVAAALVVSETVTEVKKKEGEYPAKFVNASLRKVAEYAHEWREACRFWRRGLWPSSPIGRVFWMGFLGAEFRRRTARLGLAIMSALRLRGRNFGLEWLQESDSR